MKIAVLGLDPSLRNFGIAFATIDTDTLAVEVTDLELVGTEAEKDKKTRKVVRKNSEDLERAKLLYQGMIAACQGRAMCFAEVPVGSQSARAMASYGMCVGVLAACPIPMIQVTPSEVKVAGFGVKTATKEEMIEWATAKHPLAPWLTVKRGGVATPTAKNEHLADAVAAIYAGMATDEFKRMVAMWRSMPAAA